MKIPPAQLRILPCLVALGLGWNADAEPVEKALPQPPVVVKAEKIPPTFADVAYGDHPRQKLDLWLAHSDKPTPLVFYIHGGGWVTQDKSDIDDHLDVRALLDAGISVATVNYRFLQDAYAADVLPPIQWPLHDARRALQFLRSKAGEWRLDKTRIAASGVSAGGGTSLWLAMHPDMVDPASTDPVARESTRLFCVGVKAPVVSLDPQQVRSWIPNAIFGAHAFGYLNLTRPASFEPFLAARESHLADIRRYSPYEFASKDAPPIYIEFPNQDKPPVPGEAQTDPNHSAISGLMLQKRLRALGASAELQYPSAPDTSHANMQAYLTEMLTRSTAQTSTPAPKTEHWIVEHGPTIPGLEHGTFESPSVKATVGYTVWLPPSYVSTPARLPAIYFLHGAGGDEYAGTGAIIPRLRDAIAARQLPPVLCVFANADHTGYRDDESTGVLGESEIVRDLLPVIDAKYRTAADRRAVIGFSMGASGAIRFAVRHPDLFTAAIGWGGGYRGAADYARQNLDALKSHHTGLMVVIGDKDNVTLNEAFTAELKSMDLPYNYQILPGVGHDLAAYLAGTWPQALKFLADHLAR